MGACLCRGHKDLQHPMTVVPAQTDAEPPSPQKDAENPSNGSVAEKANGYDIGVLATSTLMGLVATIKEHITKPTAMAQGRVAHLIEWKGWGRGGDTTGGWSGAWGGQGSGGWGGVGADLQEDEQFYSQMTDEIKEARFAAGVAEQFALAEAAMSVWSMDDCVDQPSTSLQAPQSHLLPPLLLDGGCISIPQHLYSIHGQTYGLGAEAHLLPRPVAAAGSPVSHPRPNGELHFRDTVTVGAAVRHVDSSSLSEDDVFYN